jgi:aspartate racemase
VPRPERTLGVLGGMGPAASAEFLRLLAAAAPAAADQEHPRVLMLSDTAIPDRTAAILGDGADPTPYIKAGLLTLTHWGADVLAMPCNTAHVFIEDILPTLPAPLIHIVDATLREASCVSPRGSWLMASTGTVLSGLYQRRAKELRYTLAVPDQQVQDDVHDAGLLVKANRMTEAGDRFREVALRLWQRESMPLMAACTELPLCHAAAGLPPETMISSLAALARACTHYLYGALASADPRRGDERSGGPHA